jgi:hypothetical protein
MVDACNLFNIHKLNHNKIPPTQSSVSTQIDCIFVSSLTAEFVYCSGILDFNTIFSSDHRPICIDIDIPRLLGYPVQGKIKAFERDLNLNDPGLIDAYQASLIQQLLNHNVGPRVDALYSFNP